MKVVGGNKENGIEVGNHYDKYNSKNPIVKLIMQGFDANLQALVEQTKAQDIHEIGCGEGYWTLKWATQGINSRGSDFSEIAIKLANENADLSNLNVSFTKKSIYDMSVAQDAATLIVCCEVLEHLEYSEKALEILNMLADPYLILSVPREPIWSTLNLIRGKYWKDFGNTPGHIQKWSKNSFVKLVSNYLEIIEVRCPLPWTMLLCKKKV